MFRTPLRAGNTRRPRLRGGEGLCTARGCVDILQGLSIMAARVSGRNLCYAEAVRTVGRNVDRWIFRTQVATPYRSEERVVAGKASSDILLTRMQFSPWFSPCSELFSHERAGAHAKIFFIDVLSASSYSSFPFECLPAARRAAQLLGPSQHGEHGQASGPLA